MAKPLKAVLLDGRAAARKSTISEKFDNRRTKELVIAFCGPVGSRIKDVMGAVQEELKGHGYHIEPIKLSKLIEKYTDNLDSAGLKDKASRYSLLQNYGNNLRKSHGGNLLAQLAVRDINLKRQEGFENSGQQRKEDYTEKVAFLIDSLKHPDEVALLRKVYRGIFNLIGVFCSAEEREKTLKREIGNGRDREIKDIILRDMKEDEGFGQQLSDTLQYADFFINNTNRHKGDSYDMPLTRFCGH